MYYRILNLNIRQLIFSSIAYSSYGDFCGDTSGRVTQQLPCLRPGAAESPLPFSAAKMVAHSLLRHIPGVDTTVLL